MDSEKGFYLLRGFSSSWKPSLKLVTNNKKEHILTNAIDFLAT